MQAIMRGNMNLNSGLLQPTEQCIRLVFDTNRFLAVRTQENNWEPGYRGTVVYEIYLEKYSIEDGWQELYSEVNGLYCVFGPPKEIEVDYPGFSKVPTESKDLRGWVQAVWCAHTLITEDKDNYISFLHVLGVKT